MVKQITNDVEVPIVSGIVDADKILVVTAAGLRKILKSSLLVAAGKVTVDDTGLTNLAGEDLDAIIAAVDTALSNVATDAEDISVADTAEHFTGTDVEAVLAEVGTALDDVSSAAEDVTVADAGSFFTGTDAEAALQEVGRVNPEADADGHRVPIRDAAGATVGYVGWSVAAPNATVLWTGDVAVPDLLNGPMVAVYSNGSVYLQDGDGGAMIFLDGATNGIEIRASKIAMFWGSLGIDGTDTPTTAAELADVLVNLGVIASHTIT